MQWLLDILKSRGKAGGVGSVILGVYVLVEHFVGGGEKNPDMLSVGLLAITNGLGLFGIRVKQDK